MGALEDYCRADVKLTGRLRDAMLCRCCRPAPVALNVIQLPVSRPFESCIFDHGCIQDSLCGKLGRCAWGAK